MYIKYNNINFVLDMEFCQIKSKQFFSFLKFLSLNTYLLLKYFIIHIANPVVRVDQKALY